MADPLAPPSASRSQPNVLVLGGHGFIGRHAVHALLDAGACVTIGTRAPRSDAETAQVKLVLHKMLNAEDWRETAASFDAVLNCVGILRQRPGETYDAVHHLAPKAIASACAQTGTRFVHVSALGLSPTAMSRFLTSKYKGEQAISASGANWAIARLSLLDGEGGYGAAWLRGVSRLPLFVVPTSARGLIAALTATDAGEALARLCLRPQVDLRTFELGGNHPLSFEDYIRGLRARDHNKDAVAIPIPGWLARLGAHLFDVLHFSPFSFGHCELLCNDNVPNPNHLETLLGRPAQRVV